jgi:hypothetical protein
MHGKDLRHPQASMYLQVTKGGDYTEAANMRNLPR